MNQPNPSSPAAPSVANVITFDEVMATADLLGGQHGVAKDVQIKSLLKTLEGAYHGVLDLKKNKHGTDCDDATKFAERYFKARNGNVIFDAKDDNQQKLASNIRTAIKLGSTPKYGNGEPIATVNNLMAMRQKLKAGPERKRLDDAANTFLRFARTQLKQDTLLSDDECRELCFKPVKDDTTVEAILEAARKKLDNLIQGKAGKGQLQCKSPNVMSARHALSQELAAIAKAKPKAV